MEKKKIAIIGIGGRTGTMFAFELRNSNEILGIGREKEIELIKKGSLYVEKKGEKPEKFEEKVIQDIEFRDEIKPDFIFLTTKNPVSLPIKYYYQEFEGKEKIPTLLISQNGIAAIAEAQEILKEIFGGNLEKIRLVRIILFNPIDKGETEDRVFIKYSLPIRIAIAKVFGPGEIKDIVEVFKKSNFELKLFSASQAKNLEFSKLFLNLIGMAAASQGFSIEEGFKNKEIFKEEVEALKEYIKVIKTSGGRFLNFPRYPVKILAILVSWLPVVFLSVLRNILAGLISEGRSGKPKDLDEIDYYNGAVVNLGKKIGVETPINEKIYQRALEKLSTSGRTPI